MVYSVVLSLGGSCDGVSRTAIDKAIAAGERRLDSAGGVVVESGKVAVDLAVDLAVDGGEVAVDAAVEVVDAAVGGGEVAGVFLEQRWESKSCKSAGGLVLCSRAGAAGPERWLSLAKNLAAPSEAPAPPPPSSRVAQRLRLPIVEFHQFLDVSYKDRSENLPERKPHGLPMALEGTLLQ
ncbi:hypothetical protein D9613_012945 [Agrocybe pediades]|uniref:Uncharacterized protein n=1 Tax=Agrocybe pediades TaxID=84607 RepID=A0A8H4QEG0_9AGAR|nr:hypothetical protein D9613_012945 [Agrocybe pediades]